MTIKIRRDSMPGAGKRRKSPGEEPEADLPGLSGLREGVLNATVRHLPSRRTVRRDGVAGLTHAVANVPDGMASGVAELWMAVIVIALRRQAQQTDPSKIRLAYLERDGKISFIPQDLA